MVNSRNPAKTAGKQQNNMKRKSNRLWQALVLLALTATVTWTLVWLMVDAIMGGAI
jgi:hypothetical protein